MAETYNINGIILKRMPFREVDSLITVYSREKGKLFLVARGTKKISSKLAGHIEPLSSSKIMVARGKIYDYLSAVVSDDSFRFIKEDLDKIKIASRGIKVFNELVKENLSEEKLFLVLHNFLEFLNQKHVKVENELFSSVFILKLLSELGYRPVFNQCVECGNKFSNENLKFDFSKSGIICSECQCDNQHLILTPNAIDALLLILKLEYKELNNENINNNYKEINHFVKLFYKYNFV